MTDGLNNIEVAVLTKINDLAARYGLRPYHCVATIDKQSEEMVGLGVRFDVPAETVGNAEKQVKKMLNSLGVGFPQGVLKGGEIAVIDALDTALHVAPKPRPRS